MRLKLLACLVAAGALAIAIPAVAAPFLSVDVNGSNASPPAAGPTGAGFEGWDAFEGLFLDPSVDWSGSGASGLTKVFSTSEGDITANMVGDGSSLGARDRGANGGALSDIDRDFVFAQRDGAIGFGRNYIKLELSGLNPNETYRFTGFVREPFNGQTGEMDTSYQAWTDLAALGGTDDGPAAWLDTNVGVGESYGPTYGADPMAADYGVYKNPIPTLARSRISGPDSDATEGVYGVYRATFDTTADSSGVVTVYTWADPQGFSGVQGATLLNAFRLGPIPEPSTLLLCALGLTAVVGQRRRVR
jgi:hypothetical protein